MTYIFKVETGRTIPSGDKFFASIKIHNCETRKDLVEIKVWERKIDSDCFAENSAEFVNIEECMELLFPNRTKTKNIKGIRSFFVKQNGYKVFNEAVDAATLIADDFQAQLNQIANLCSDDVDEPQCVA